MSVHMFSVECGEGQSIIIQLPEGYATVSCFRGEHKVTLTNYNSLTHEFFTTDDGINSSIEIVKKVCK